MSTPLAEKRLGRIVMLLDEHGPLRTTALTEMLGVSGATIRRDLEVLAGRGLIRKVHGGAARVSAPLPEGAAAPIRHQDQFYRDRQQVNQAGKQQLAQLALSVIQPGQTVYLDAGTTALALAQALRRTPQLTRTLRVVTHGIDVAYELNGECHLFMVGGEVYSSTYSVTGPDTLATINRYSYDVFFVGCTSIDPNGGGQLTNSNGIEAAQKTAIMRRAQRTVLIADQTKWGKPGFAAFAALKDIQLWITDQATLEAHKLCEAAGVVVKTAFST